MFPLTRAHKSSYGGPATSATIRHLTGQVMIHMITTKTVEKTCRCGQLIYAGIAEGLPARVDVEALDRAQEITALLDGRWTFALTRWGALVHRHEGRIRTGYVGESIHAQHRCPQIYTQPTLTGATQ